MTSRDVATLLAAIIFSLAAAAHASSDDDTVYAKNISGGRRLLVLKAELPKPEPTKDAAGKPIPVEWPEHVYEYTFAVQSADGATRQVVGKKRMGTMPGEVERMEFMVLDAIVDENQLVVLYRLGRATFGDTALVGASGSGFLLGRSKPLSWLALDFVESGTYVIGGRLEGSPKRGDLRAIVTENVIGHTVDRRFLLVNDDGNYKWAPTAPAKP